MFDIRINLFAYHSFPGWLQRVKGETETHILTCSDGEFLINQEMEFMMIWKCSSLLWKMC